MVREPNARMCGWNCEPACTISEWFAYRSPQTEMCQFLQEHKENWMRAACPFHAPDVLCSPQVGKKLINRASNTRRTRTAQHTGVYKVLLTLVGLRLL